ncbi:MAG: hypothetical protein RLZZ444_3172 [Pseudomonadota bacterium]|jgi:hypothetical protein
MRNRNSQFSFPALGLVVGMGVIALLSNGKAGAFITHAATSLNPSCTIKGNISLNNGTKIYHLPGQEFYNDTRISLDRGERWFCTEAEARAAGWRKARSG